MHSEETKQISRNTKCLKACFLFMVFTILWFIFLWLILMTSKSSGIFITSNKVQEMEKSSNILDINDIKRKISLINKEEKIFNKKRYGPLLNDSLVIVVQVHSRILYLKHLIASLRVAEGISNVLLIFSHDYFDEEINNLIQSIRFCKVMQIFYPYSIQIYPHEFPGSDSNDCSSDVSENTTPRKMNINDLYLDDDNETCRNPRKLQVKHHWWWKANRIFDLTTLKVFENAVLFLEDDFYLVEDFIPALKLMESVSKEHCQNCKIMSLAVYTEAVEMYSIYSEFLSTVTISNQFSNMLGLAFTRATWLEIIQCRHSFCVYNEHNWDFSLKNVLTTCMQNVMAMTVNAPRVYHLGTCGMHFKADDCDPSARLSEIYAEIFKYRTSLYPKHFKLVYRLNSHSNVGGPYGGWSDSRDQALCLHMVKMNYSNNYSVPDIILHS